MLERTIWLSQLFVELASLLARTVQVVCRHERHVRDVVELVVTQLVLHALLAPHHPRAWAAETEIHHSTHNEIFFGPKSDQF